MNFGAGDEQAMEKVVECGQIGGKFSGPSHGLIAIDCKCGDGELSTD